MKLTLRKANALQLLITEQINNTMVVTETTITRHNDTRAAVREALAEFESAVTKKVELLGVLYHIRDRVGEASHSAGINKILTEFAFIEKLIALFRSLGTGTDKLFPGEEQVELAQKDLQLQDAARVYGRQDSLTVGILTKDNLVIYIRKAAELRKQKQNLSDKLLELNIRTEIEVDAQDESVLRKYDII